MIFGLKWAVVAAYGKRHLGSQRSEIWTMTDQLKTAHNSLLNEAQWLSNNTRNALVDKVMDMKRVIGCPDWVLNDTALEGYYQGVSFFL